MAASPHARAAKTIYEVAGAISEHISRRFEQAEQGKATLTAFEQDMRDGHNNAFRDMDEVVAWAPLVRASGARVEKPHRAAAPRIRVSRPRGGNNV